jgi:hypothetical protein
MYEERETNGAARVYPTTNKRSFLNKES